MVDGPIRLLYAGGDDAFVEQVKAAEATDGTDVSSSAPDPSDADPTDVATPGRRAERRNDRLELVQVRELGAALDVLDAEQIDCVVAERSVRGESGIDLLERVRGRDPDLPVVLLVEEHGESVAAEAIRAGVTEYFRTDEPGVHELFRSRVRRAVAGYRAEQARRERTKELTTLHAVHSALAADAPLSDRLQSVVTALPAGLQRPDVTAVRLTVDDRRYETANARELPETATEPIETEAGPSRESAEHTVDPKGNDHETVRTVTVTAGDTAVRLTAGLLVGDPDGATATDIGFLPEETDLLRSVVELVATHVDRADTAERLRVYADRMKTTLQHTTNLVFMKDLDGRYLLVNRAFAEFVDMDRDEIPGRTAAEVHDADTARWIREHDRETIAAGELRRFKERYSTGDDPRRFVTVRVPVFDADGEPYAVYGIATDISEETRLAEERVTLLDRMTDGFLAVDDDDAITFINRRAVELVHGTPNEGGNDDNAGAIAEALVGEPLREVFHPARSTAFAEAFEAAKDAGEATSVTIRYDPADGWFEARIYPSDTGVSVYLRDVTETVREREELERR